MSRAIMINRVFGVVSLIPSYVYGSIVAVFFSCPQAKPTPTSIFLANTASILFGGGIILAPVGTIITGSPIWLIPNFIISMPVFYTIIKSKLSND